MADLSLDSPARFRLAAAAAAMVGSLALVALGVQLGTDGLGSTGPDRNPVTETASPTAAVVAQPRSQPPAGLDETLVSLVPSGLAVPTGGGPVGGAPGSTGPTPPPAPPAAQPGPGSAPDPAPPGPVPVPTPAPPGPLPLLPTPDPSPLLEPLEPVLDPVLDALEPVTGPSSSPDATATEPESTGLLLTLKGLLGL